VDLAADDVARHLADAFERVGFATIVNHGVDSAVVDTAWATAGAFFDLPLIDRMSVAMPYPGYPYGYSPLDTEVLTASLSADTSTPDSSMPSSPSSYEHHPDRKESLAIGPVTVPSHRFADNDETFAWSPNLWPSALPALRSAWENYYSAMADLARRLLSLMADALSLPVDYFESLIDRHTSAMRALNYPGRDGLDGSSEFASDAGVAVGSDGRTIVAQDRTRAGERLGAGAHTDYGTLTILFADPAVAGLQIQAPDSSWHDVAPVPNSFVINLGDAMARWTNDRWKSTMHRVQIPAQRRQSIAFFHNANWDAVIECLPTCLAPGQHPKYPPMAAGPHLMHKFRATQATSVSPLDADEVATP
jgi:isopenicillin N synthase-like dioxygenase